MKINASINLAIVIMLLIFEPSKAIAQSSLRSLPANTAPGLVEFRQNQGDVSFFSLEMNGWSKFQSIDDWPWPKMKGDRNEAVTSKLGCYPAREAMACLVDALFDGKREIWFVRREAASSEAEAIQLPERVVGDLFWSSPISSLVGNGPLTLAALPIDNDIPAKVWVENRGAGPKFHSYELPDTNQLVMARPSFNGHKLSGLFLVLSKIAEPYITPSEGIEILAADATGAFATFAVPPNCEVLGAINDTVICGENTRGNSYSSPHSPYPKVMRLRLPKGVAEEITRNNQAPAIQAVGDDILVRGMVAGVARTFIQNVNGGPAEAALFEPENCISEHEHVDVFEVTVSETAALMRIVSPLRSTRLILAPIKERQIHICDPSAQLYREEPAEPLDHSNFRIDRVQSSVSKEVPVTLVSGPSEGALSGHLLTITYPHAALWLPEGYLGPWLTQWVGQGGKVAFVHLPGGGGYGAAWSSGGFGIRNKIKVSELFDEVTKDLVNRGLVDDGKISVLTESGGGPVMAHAILRSPSRYAAFALRAACLSIEGEKRENCAGYYDFGNWLDLDDRHLIDDFEPLDRISQSERFPSIIFGIPQFDSQVDVEYQRRMARSLDEKVVKTVTFEGVNHTDRSTPEAEADWVEAIAVAAMAANAQ